MIFHVRVKSILHHINLSHLVAKVVDSHSLLKNYQIETMPKLNFAKDQLKIYRCYYYHTDSSTIDLNHILEYNSNIDCTLHHSTAADH